MNRTEQRDWVFKLIFEDSINKIEDVEQSLNNHDLDGEEFIINSLKSYNENYEKIEEIIKNASKKRYNRLSKVEKAILFLSVNEIYFMDIPHQVSINEAVELAKTYSNQMDYQMINSILGKIVRTDA
ncbi:transcription antitermination factor NusB [Anaerococcus sp. Marseille-Q7828]|uniref:transcription antitermination factor NusB n=1 Tax=Anaerococcus sp. Marseille-Q7828 TaxID=3036300 RepID=UPI0024AD0442|nr:transcription antitermination factor NusB [Anaerococcus sp. Marseille-Q7828]